jgi:V/A-type H+-transporting ATPase subunit B
MFPESELNRIDEEMIERYYLDEESETVEATAD